MKIYYLIAVVVLALGCKESTKQDNATTEATNTEQTKTNSEPAITDAKQNGDYTSLFNSPDCKVITAEEISAALGVEFTDKNIKNICSFKSEFPNNKTWNLSIMRNDMSPKDAQREIESFKSDETGMLMLKMSDDGDSYLCNQHSHGYLSIYNPNYNGSIGIRYGSVAESRSFTKEERLEHRELAFKLANTILKKHKK